MADFDPSARRSTMEQDLAYAMAQLDLDEGLSSYLSLIRGRLEQGLMQGEISCGDFQARFYEMLERRYVDSEPDNRRNFNDFELGYHAAGCDNPACDTLIGLYFTVIRTAPPDQARQNALTILALRAEADYQSPPGSDPLEHA